MIAILSDIHGNLEALEAVLRDAERMRTDFLICLGDIIGYGPNPIECTELVTKFDIVLKGDSEETFLHDEDFPDRPHKINQLFARLRKRFRDHPNGQQYTDFLRRCPIKHKTYNSVYVHGSPRDPLREYVFPEHIHDDLKLTRVFSHFDKLCFCGSSHIAGLFTNDDNGEWVYVSPVECGNVFSLGEQQVLCSVGSVGQPRDSDPRASYVVFDGSTITFRRIDYDIDRTIAKIRSGGDDDMHGDRLRSGR